MAWLKSLISSRRMQGSTNALLKTPEAKTLQEDVSLTMVGNLSSASLPLFFTHETQAALGCPGISIFCSSIRHLGLKTRGILSAPTKWELLQQFLAKISKKWLKSSQGLLRVKQSVLVLGFFWFFSMMERLFLKNPFLLGPLVKPSIFSQLDLFGGSFRPPVYVKYKFCLALWKDYWRIFSILCFQNSQFLF